VAIGCVREIFVRACLWISSPSSLFFWAQARQISTAGWHRDWKTTRRMVSRVNGSGEEGGCERGRASRTVFHSHHHRVPWQVLTEALDLARRQVEHNRACWCYQQHAHRKRYPPWLHHTPFSALPVSDADRLFVSFRHPRSQNFSFLQNFLFTLERKFEEWCDSSSQLLAVSLWRPHTHRQWHPPGPCWQSPPFPLVPLVSEILLQILLFFAAPEA